MSENAPSRDTPIPWWQARALLHGGNWTDAAYGFGGPDVAEAVGTAEEISSLREDSKTAPTPFNSFPLWVDQISAWTMAARACCLTRNPITQERRMRMRDDPTEPIRRRMIAEESAAGPPSKEALEAAVGRLWTTDELTAEFEVRGFLAPLCVVRRRSDNQVGSLRFSFASDGQRYYHSWEEHRP